MIEVLTALPGAAWESTLVAALAREVGDVSVVRRCVDLADLLATAASGTGRVVLLSADLRRLDRDALARLAVNGVGVVGLTSPGDEAGERRLRMLGVDCVLPADAELQDIGQAIREALAHAPARPAEPPRSGASDDRALAPLTASLAFAEPWRAVSELSRQAQGLDGAAGFDELGLRDDSDGTADGEQPAGRLVAVWGPGGAPGRSSVAVNLASEVARLGRPALLADVDSYASCLAQLLGLLDEAPGIAAAARLAGSGALDLPALARVAPVVQPGLRILTGIARADRWTELRPPALERVWELCRLLAAVTVADCSASLEQDEELSFDTAAPRRNGATITTLACADVIVAVCGAGPVGVQRFARELPALRELAPGTPVRVVVNRVRASAVGGNPERQLREALERHCGLRDVVLVPDDVTAFDAAVLGGLTLAEAAPRSPARAPLVALAAALAQVAAPGGRGRRRTRVAVG